MSSFTSVTSPIIADFVSDDDDGGDDARPKDPAEALADLFHECLQNLSYLSTVVKM